MSRAWPASMWAPALLAFVLADDALIRALRPSYAVLGLLDEPAHLATGALAVATIALAVGGLPRPAWIAALASTVLIDVDHLPDVLGTQILTAGAPRPYTHSLTTVAVLAVAAIAVRGRSVSPGLAGAALGVAAHLLRDLGTAPVALWWPVSSDGVSVPYIVYAAVLAATVVAIESLHSGRPYVRRRAG